jgi:hypothetical protein
LEGPGEELMKEKEKTPTPTRLTTTYTYIYIYIYIFFCNVFVQELRRKCDEPSNLWSHLQHCGAF